MFLSVEDIERLTGYKHRSKQCEQLANMHIPYHVNARGEPIVSIAYINGTSKKPEQPAKAWQPNLLKFG